MTLRQPIGESIHPSACLCTNFSPAHYVQKYISPCTVFRVDAVSLPWVLTSVETLRCITDAACLLSVCLSAAQALARTGFRPPAARGPEADKDQSETKMPSFDDTQLLRATCDKDPSIDTWSTDCFGGKLTGRMYSGDTRAPTRWPIRIRWESALVTFTRAILSNEDDNEIALCSYAALTV